MRTTARPIKWHIAIFGLLIVLPLLAVQAFFLYQYAQREKDALADSTMTVAADLWARIDQALRSGEFTLLALSTSPHLEKRDIAAFHQQAVRVAREIPGSIIGLRDQGSILMTTSRPPDFLFGSIDPRLKHADEQACASGAPVVADLYLGSTTGDRYVNVQTPVVVAGKCLVLSLALNSERIAALMMQASLGPSSVAAVTDRNRVIVARTRDNDVFAGKRASDLFAANATGQSGQFVGRTFDGVAVMNAYVRSPYTGWVVAAAVPMSTLQLPLSRTFWQLGATSVFAWGLATLLAVSYGRRFTEPLAKLKRMAAAGAARENTQGIATSVTEFNVLSDAFVAAFGQIRQHAVQQDLVLREFSHRLKNSLMTVQALASLSGKSAVSVSAFQESFSERIAALGRSHDLLLQRNGSSAHFGELIRAASEPFYHAGRVHVTGEDPLLNGNDSIALGLVLHELFTNAVKHGALSHEAGRIDIVMTSSDAGLAMRWQEHGGEPVSVFKGKGFGNTLMGAMARQLRGSIERTATADGFTLALRIGRAGDAQDAVEPEPSGQDRSAQDAAGRDASPPAAAAAGPARRSAADDATDIATTMGFRQKTYG